MLKKLFYSICLLVLIIGQAAPQKGTAAEGIELYTAYTGISVTPGETIDYSFEVLNHTNTTQHVSLSIEGLQKGWQATINSDGWDVQQLSVKPGEPKSLSINVTVPLEVEKGNYQFTAVAEAESGLTAELPLAVTVSEQGTFRTELTSEQPNLEGHSDSSFEYKAELKNRTASEQNYALTSKAPEGWGVTFQADGKNVTSVTVDSNGTKEITVSVTPPETVKADTYEIPILASNESTSAELVLEAAISGKYSLEIKTPSGKLSDDITAGDEKTIDIVVKNTGTIPINDIALSSNKPTDWEVTFEPGSIPTIEPGKQETVQAIIKASENAIAGDYVVEMTATAPEASANAQFRMSVETSLIWGWIGVLIILGVVGGIYYLIRKYGRR
ncbi:MAG TPA: NEW3 domain-containing protein [Bacillus sp. (in: firmicutes)]|nr:NEW3 domain-containing protein [Bacillus sp. (in: firmicutes)]